MSNPYKHRHDDDTCLACAWENKIKPVKIKVTPKMVEAAIFAWLNRGCWESADEWMRRALKAALDAAGRKG